MFYSLHYSNMSNWLEVNPIQTWVNKELLLSHTNKYNRFLC